MKNKLVDNDDGTVTDEINGLMWQQETPDNKMMWEEAKKFCKELNLADHIWRMPTIHELKNLVEYKRYNPAINNICFPNTFSDFYWSSTTFAYHTDSAWGVDFEYGNDYSYYKGGESYIRAVRTINGGKVMSEEAVKIKLLYQPENLVITIDGDGMNLYQFAKKLYDLAEIDSIKETLTNDCRYIEFTQEFNYE